MHDGHVVSLTARWSRLVHIVALVAVGLAAAAESSAASAPHADAARLLEIDQAALGESTDPVRSRFDEIAAAFEKCRQGRPKHDSVACLRAMVDGLSVVNDASTVRESTVTGLLLDHRGSCAALVALAITLDRNAWHAYVLRDHVLLQTTGDTPRFLEVTDRARDISERELRNRFKGQLDCAVAVPAKRFPAYYADNLAVRVAGEGRAEDAERLFRRAIELGPKEGRPRLNYGTFLLEQGRVDEARGQLKKATRRAPKDPDAWTNLGVAHARIGEPIDALDCFERALELEPGNQAARTNLAAIKPKPADGHTGPK